MIDPTREQCLEICHRYSRDDFDVESAIYWFAADWHGGQASNLYSVLSSSEYSPGAIERGVEPNSMAHEMYCALQEEFCDPPED